MGNAFFNSAWVVAPASAAARDGLGPMFNARSCDACHNNDGRGQPPATGRRASRLTRHSVRNALARQSTTNRAPIRATAAISIRLRSAALPPKATCGSDTARFPDASPMASASRCRHRSIRSRNSPTVNWRPARRSRRASRRRCSDQDCLRRCPRRRSSNAAIRTIAMATASRAARIASGICSPAQVALGRFGWKANQPGHRASDRGGIRRRDRHVVVAAPRTELHERADGMHGRARRRQARRSATRSSRTSSTISACSRSRRGAISNPLKCSAALNCSSTSGCAACHRPTLSTGEDANEPWLSSQTIHPYTDLLLHDMGPDLADGRADFEASGSEWRTPPLWGLGLQQAVNGHTRLLHDGRARDVSEAILWHGGEAERARRSLSRSCRKSIARPCWRFSIHCNWRVTCD